MKSRISVIIITLISLCCVSGFIGLIGGSLPFLNSLNARLEGPIICPQGSLTFKSYSNGNNDYTTYYCEVNGKLQDAEFQFPIVTTLMWGTPLFIVLLICYGLWLLVSYLLSLSKK